MKLPELLPKGIPLPEIIRREEEWKAPPPMADSASFDTRIRTANATAFSLSFLLLLFAAELSTLFAVLIITFLPIFFMGTTLYSLHIGRPVSTFLAGLLMFVLLGLAEMWIALLTGLDIISAEGEAAARPVWLTVISLLYIPVFLLTVYKPAGTLIALFIRKLRCTKEVKAVFKGCGYAGTNAYTAGLEHFIGSAHYHYESDGAVYVAVYSDTPEVMYPRGSVAYLKIDPDYPEYYYDPDTARELRPRCFGHLFPGLLMLAVAVLNVALLGFHILDL